MRIETFSSCIEISNELINRNKVSGTANRALRQLLYDFLDHEGKENLGYTKFPAERAIFDTVFLQHGLYAKRYKSWKFISPAASKSEFGKKLDKLFKLPWSFSSRTETGSYPSLRSMKNLEQAALWCEGRFVSTVHVHFYSLIFIEYRILP